MIKPSRFYGWLIGIGLLLCSLAPQIALAQPGSQIPVEIVDQSDDAVGRLYVAAFRDKLAQSEHFRITNRKEPRLRIVITTMDKYEDYPNTVTIYSVIWSFAAKSSASLYLNNTLGYCGITKVDVSTDKLLHRTEKLVLSLEKLVQGQKDIPES